MARRIDWDKVHRYKKARKPDYREALRDAGLLVDVGLVGISERKALSKGSRWLYKFSRSNPKTAHDIKERLSFFSVTGTKRRNLTNAILSGKKQMAAVEVELMIEMLVNEGFELVEPEICGDTAILRFVKFARGRTPEQEATITMRKPTSGNKGIKGKAAA